jgi:hypothetical protein
MKKPSWMEREREATRFKPSPMISSSLILLLLLRRRRQPFMIMSSNINT